MSTETIELIICHSCSGSKPKDCFRIMYNTYGGEKKAYRDTTCNDCRTMARKVGGTKNFLELLRNDPEFKLSVAVMGMDQKALDQIKPIVVDKKEGWKNRGVLPKPKIKEVPVIDKKEFKTKSVEELMLDRYRTREEIANENYNEVQNKM
jgi:hypothetical protein